MSTILFDTKTPKAREYVKVKQGCFGLDSLIYWGDSIFSLMPGCHPNALPKNRIELLQSVACILIILPASRKLIISVKAETYQA